jgi:plastocyanin
MQAVTFPGMPTVMPRRRLASSLLSLGVLSCVRAPHVSYQPRVRDFTVTTVPLLTEEQRHLYPFLARDFAPGGVLAGKEVYAFSPSTFAVVAGDTIRFTLINPTDDPHTFVLPDSTIQLPSQQTVTATYVTSRPGTFPIRCDVPEHAPMMWGQLIVLSPVAAAQEPVGGH